MLLSAINWHKRNLKTDIKFITGMNKIFVNPYYLPALEEVAIKYGCQLITRHDLIEVDGERKTALFQNLDNSQMVEEKFELLQVCPIMRDLSFWLIQN